MRFEPAIRRVVAGRLAD